MKRALFCLALVACAHPPPQTPNDVFRAAYHDARSRALANAGPIIVVDGDRAVLIDGGKREPVVIRDAHYHAIKQAAHGALGVFAALWDVDGPLPPDRATTLRGLRDALLHTPSPDPSASASLQTALLVPMLNGVLARNESRRPDLDARARTLGPELLAAAQEAAALELAALDGAVKRWQTGLGDRWARLHVVVIGSHMAREHEIALDYFLHVLGESAEGGRVVYAESPLEEPGALELLATHLIDAQVAAAFFGDPMRLHRDLLSK
jgi:hypothetical protein